MTDRLRNAYRAIGRLQRRAVAAVRREPLIWSAAVLVALIAVVTVLSNGQAGPVSPPLSPSGQLEQARMLSTVRKSAVAQALANQAAQTHAAPPAPRTSVGAPATPALATTLPATAVWPLHGRVAMGYGWVFDPTGGYWFYHTGWEIEAKSGSAVRAALPGSVEAVEREASGGFTVVVRSPQNVIATYTGLASTQIAVGSPVGQGETIGSLQAASGGSIGRLGFSIKRAGQPVNPATMLPKTTAGASRQG